MRSSVDELKQIWALEETPEPEVPADYIYGYRIWNLYERNLYSPFSLIQVPWKKTMKALCQHSSASVEKSHLESCSCGLSAFYSIQEAVSMALAKSFYQKDRFSQTFCSDPIAIGMVRAKKNDIVLQEYGWKSLSLETTNIFEFSPVFIKNTKTEGFRYRLSDYGLAGEVYLDRLRGFAKEEIKDSDERFKWSENKGELYSLKSYLAAAEDLRALCEDLGIDFLESSAAKGIRRALISSDQELDNESSISRVEKLLGQRNSSQIESASGHGTFSDAADNYNRFTKNILKENKIAARKAARIKRKENKLKALKDNNNVFQTSALGYRAWEIDNSEKQRRLVPSTRAYIDDCHFLPGMNTASCNCCNDTPNTYTLKGIPRNGHSCGFHAFHSFSKASSSEYNNKNSDGLSIVGAIAGSGKVQMHSTGWRSKKAELIALYTDKKDFDGPSRYRIVSLARYYRVPIFTDRKLFKNYTKSKALPIQKISPKRFPLSPKDAYNAHLLRVAAFYISLAAIIYFIANLS